MSAFPLARTTRALFTAGLFALTASVATPVLAQSCDRTCMSALLTTYIDALVAHDASKLPLTVN